MLRVSLGSALCAAALFIGLFSVGANAASRSVRHRAGGASLPSATGTTTAASAPGNWSTIDSPSVGGEHSQNFLFGLSCVSASDCWAAGYVLPAGSTSGITLIEHYDGAAWSVVDSPNSSAGTANYLQAVKCVTSSNCWTAGYYYNGTIFQTLIEHFDGTEWSIVSSPNQLDGNGNAQSNELFAVACNAVDDCWAAGGTIANSAPFFALGQPSLEHYDGTSWSVVTSPPVTAADGFLYGITCTATDDCWAVGEVSDSLGAETLIEHYDGSAWTIVSSPNSANEQNYLYGVACSSASDCWAVGYDYTQDAQPYRTLIEHYDGTSWSIVSSPNASSTQGNFFQAVTCAKQNDCWAVGYYVNDADTNTFTLSEHYDGSAWTVVDTPNLGRGADDLQAIECLTAGDCWAVGYSYDYAAATQYTLAEHYVIPLQITSIAWLTNGNISVSGDTAPMLSIQIQRSDDLLQFNDLAPATADENGLWMFEDRNPGLAPRFYRVVYR